MTILTHDPYITAARADAFDARLVDLERLLRETTSSRCTSRSPRRPWG